MRAMLRIGVRRGLAALSGGFSSAQLMESCCCCCSAGVEVRGAAGHWVQLSGQSRPSTSGALVSDGNASEPAYTGNEFSRRQPATAAPPHGVDEERKAGKKKTRRGGRAAALAEAEVEELNNLFEERLQQVAEEHRAEAAAALAAATAEAATPTPTPAAEATPAAAREAKEGEWGEVVEEYPLPAREVMEAFWWGFGVRDYPTLWSLVQLGFKHEFLRDPEAAKERMGRVQEELPPGLAAVELVKGWPRIVLLDPNLLSRQLKYLAELLPGQDLARMLLVAPRLASTYPSRIMHNIQDLAAMLPSLDTFELLCREPGLLTADINNQVFDTAQGLHEILEGHCDPHAAIVAQPHLLLISKSCLAKRWEQLRTAAAARETWQRELMWAANEAPMIAFFLSRPEDVLERLEFLIEVNLGQHLPLALVLSLPTEEFTQRCESFRSWCFLRRHTRHGRAQRAGEQRRPQQTWQSSGGAQPNSAQHVNGAMHDGNESRLEHEKRM